MKKILFILNTYGFQSKILNKKKSIDQNYNYFNSQDFNWPNYFFNNLKKDYITYKDYPHLNKKLLKKNDYLKYLKNKIDKIKPDLIFSTMNDNKIDSLLDRVNNSKKIIWVSYKVDINKLKKLKKSYDYILSSNKKVLFIAKKIHFKNFEMLISSPTFYRLNRKNFKSRKNNVIFIGSLGSDFSNRLNLLLNINKKLKIYLRIRNLVEKYFLMNSFNFYLRKIFPKFTEFLYKKKILPVTNNLKYFNKNEVFGSRMFDELRRFRFCLNIHSDFDQNKNINARVYEALSGGCLLFSDKNTTMQKIFKKNKHVVYYNSSSDLEKKIRFYRQNFEQSYKLAKQGNNYLISHHISHKRLKIFKKIIKIILKKN
jgi:spore maturation protein CgeB